jgi:hypothetical protein
MDWTTLLIARMVGRFGDYGIVGVLMARELGQESVISGYWCRPRDGRGVGGLCCVMATAGKRATSGRCGPYRRT